MTGKSPDFNSKETTADRSHLLRPGWLRALRSVDNWASRICLSISMVGMLLLASLSFSEVVLRFIFNSPTSWSDVSVRVILIWLVFLAAGTTFREGAAIASTFLQSSVSTKLASILETIASVAALVFFGVIISAGFYLSMRTGNQTLAGLGIPVRWLYASLPVGGGVAFFGIFVSLMDRLFGPPQYPIHTT